MSETTEEKVDKTKHTRRVRAIFDALDRNRRAGAPLPPLEKVLREADNPFGAMFEGFEDVFGSEGNPFT